MLKSPENYNQMLETLNVATGVWTFGYSVMLVYVKAIARIAPDNALIPPTKDYQELVAWAFSFGLLPIIFGLIAFAASRFFEIHNSTSKALGIRYFWDKQFIAKPLRDRAKSTLELDRDTVKQIMNGLYYPAVRGIDQHYVQLFWRYALPFWIFFEHILVILVSLVLLLMIGTISSGLILYLVAIFILCVLQFFFVTAPKSTDQANQIPSEKVTAFFEELHARIAST